MILKNKRKYRRVRDKASKIIISELDYIFISTDGNVFANRDDCITHQVDLIKKEEEQKMKVLEIIKKVLDDNGWGLVLKKAPIREVPTREEDTQLFGINLIKEKRFFDALSEELQLKEGELCSNQKEKREES